MRIINDRLDNREIRQELKKLPFLEDNKIDDLISQFWFHDFYNSLISLPQYLAYLKEFLKKNKNDFKRVDFYEFLTSSLLSHRYAKKIKKIAALMELKQVNEITFSELEKILTALKTSWKELDFDKALKNEIIKKEKNKFSFYHHTIQEYLASRFILESPNPLETAQKLMIFRKENITAFKRSWSGVLRFLLESVKVKEFIRWILEFAKKIPETIDDNFSEIITSVNPLKHKEFAKTIFDFIYKTYYRKILWIPVWARKNLGKFCDKKNLQRFKNDIKPTDNETETFVRQGNVTAIIEGILEHRKNLFTKKDLEFWKNQLIIFANDKNTNGVLQRNALSALEKFEDPSLIKDKKVEKTFEHPDSLVREAFIQFCYKTGPNELKTIDYLVKAIKGKIDIYGRFGLYEVTDKKAFKYRNSILKYYG